MLESSLRDWKFSDSWDGVPRHLCLLAGNALTRPASNVRIHRWPDKLGGNGLACAFHAWMSEPVESVENSPSPGEGDDGSCRPVGYVHDELGAVQVDLFEMEAGIAVVDGGLIIPVEGLVPRHELQVDAHLPDGVDNIS